MKMPRILLLYKHSTFRSYFLGDKKPSIDLHGLYNSTEIARFRKTHEVHYWTLAFVEAVLKSKGLIVHMVSRGKKVDYQAFDVVITVGGDGTFLEGSRNLKNQIILGVNSDPSWSVGRFCTATHKNFTHLLDSILSGRPKIKLLHRLSLNLTGHAPMNVLNDVLICHKNPAALARYYLKLGSVREEQRSSGVWVATAAGSSGAIYSAGGKLLPEASGKIQYKPRELYRARGAGYKLRGSILSMRQSIEITSLIREGAVFVDGSHVCLPFSFGSKAILKHSKFPLRVVKS